MRVLFGAVALLCVIATGGMANTLEQLAQRSAFVKANFDYLKSKNASSVYAGTKPYCPSSYWWSSRPSAKEKAASGYRQQISREMNQAGFPASAIQHCVQNSAFVFNSNALQQHPKNKRYGQYMQAGVLVYRKTGGGAVSTMPVLVETNSYADRRWHIYDASFKKICTFTGTNPNNRNNCSAFGALRATAKREGSRRTWTLQNNRYQVLILTQRTQSYAKSAIGRAF